MKFFRICCVIISEPNSLSCCLNHQGMLIPLDCLVAHNGLPGLPGLEKSALSMIDDVSRRDVHTASKIYPFGFKFSP